MFRLFKKEKKWEVSPKQELYEERRLFLLFECVKKSCLKNEFHNLYCTPYQLGGMAGELFGIRIVIIICTQQ